jgi:hypothetical protein
MWGEHAYHASGARPCLRPYMSGISSSGQGVGPISWAASHTPSHGTLDVRQPEARDIDQAQPLWPTSDGQRLGEECLVSVYPKRRGVL